MITSLRLGSDTAFEFDQLEVRTAMLLHSQNVLNTKANAFRACSWSRLSLLLIIWAWPVPTNLCIILQGSNITNL